MSSCKVYASNDGISDFKDTKSSGFVELVKSWVGVLSGNELPEVRISSDKPNKSSLGCTVTFDAGVECFPDGSKLNEVVYSKSGRVLQGNYMLPTFEDNDGEFVGWKGYTVDPQGNILSGSLAKDVRVTASMRYYVKYAVSLAGIEIDHGNWPKDAGLTFVPAFTTEYIKNPMANKYHHTPNGVTTSGNSRRCIGVDDWSTVVEWNEKDPYVYEQCIKRCTKSLTFDQTSVNSIFSDYSAPKLLGDGVSGLNIELLHNSRVFSLTGGSKWYTSRLYAVLNGSRSDTVDSDAKELFSSDNCVLSCFPLELRDAILPSEYGSLYLFYSPSGSDNTLSGYKEVKAISYPSGEYTSCFSRGVGSSLVSLFSAKDISNSNGSSSQSSANRLICFAFSLK